MKRMYSKEELNQFIEENGNNIVEALKGKDLSIESLTSKGITNTGNIANNGDIEATGTVDGKLKDGPTMTIIEGTNVEKAFEISKRLDTICFYQVKLSATDNVASGTKIGTFSYKPSSIIYLSGGSSGTAYSPLRINENGEVYTGTNYGAGGAYTYIGIIDLSNPQT